MLPGINVQGFVGAALQAWLDSLNLMQVFTYTSYVESTEDYEVLVVEILISYKPKN